MLPSSAQALSVVHVVRSDSFAGVERYICQVSAELSQRGHTVSVVGGDPARMRSELPPAVRHRPATTVARAAMALWSNGRADVVHAHMSAAEAAAVGSRPRHRAAVVSTRHFPDPRGSRRASALAGRIVARGIARQISISDFVARGIGEPSTVVPNGVAHAERASLQRPVVLMMQRLEPEKAPEVGLRAWAASGLAGSGWTLQIAGRGSLETQLRELASRLDVSSSVSFLGHVSDTDSLLASVGLFLAPAPAEPFGLSVVEAMARGLPVVAAAGGGHLETVGEGGVLFRAGDAEDAARCLASLGSYEAERRQVGGRLRERQRELFGLALHVDRLEACYRETLRLGAKVGV